MRMRVVSGAVGALLTAAGVLLVAAPAHAHDQLTSTTPSAGATVAVVPLEITLVFDKPALALGSAVRVTGPSGQVAVDAPRLVDNRVHQTVRAGSPAGRYTVDWRVTSVDGHPISDSFSFTAKAASAAAPAPSAPPTTGSASSNEESSTSWSAVGIAALAGAALGTAYVVFQRRRRGRS